MGFVAVVVYLQVNMLDFYSGNMCVESLWSLKFYYELWFTKSVGPFKQYINAMTLK